MELENDPVIPSRWSGLKTRIISAAVLLAVVLLALWQGGFLFTLLIVLASLLMIKEWHHLTEHAGPAWRAAGLAYVALPCASIIWLRGLQYVNLPDAGIRLVLFVLLAVWATDIGAFFAGRGIGGPKLAPSISPNKTWAGLGGGMGAAAVISAIAHSFTPYPPTYLSAFALGLLLAVLAQAGDLFESWLKRRAGLKDSGTLIPGHGGLLDRIDGLIFTLPFYALLVWLASIA